MKTTGALLKSKRESSSLSLSEVALATKINPKILAAIENGDEAHLPAKTFLKGFIRSYALFLKMDVDSVMRSFQEESGGPPPAPATTEPSQTTKSVKTNKNEPSASATRRRVGDESSSGLRTVAVVVIVVLIGLIIGVRELIEKYQRERVVEASADLNKATPVVTTPVSEAPAAAVAVGSTTNPADPAVASSAAAAVDVAPDTGDEVTIESATVPPAAKTVDTKAAEVVKPADTKPAEIPTGAAKSEEPKIAASPRSSQPQILSPRMDLVRMPISNLVELRPTELSPPRPEETKPADSVKPAEPVKVEEPKTAEVVKPDEPKAAEPPAVLTKAAKNEIILEALDKVEVKFQVKGETKRVSLGPTQVHTIHAELPMTLDLSDGGAVNIILNGRERGVPGDLGKPKTIKIP